MEEGVAFPASVSRAQADRLAAGAVNPIPFLQFKDCQVVFMVEMLVLHSDLFNQIGLEESRRPIADVRIYSQYLSHKI